MSNRPDETIDAYFEPGERVLWRGTPAQGLRLKPSDWVMIPFSLMWGGFAIFWETMALSGTVNSPAAWFFPLWGVPFVLIGLYMMIGRFFDDAWLRRTAEYAVTDARVLILRGRFSRTLTALPLATLPPMVLSANPAGVGSIQFGVATRGTSAPSLDFVDDARSVLAIIEAARRKTA